VLRSFLYFTLFLLLVGGALAGSWYMGWIDDEVDAAKRMVRSTGLSLAVSSAVSDGDRRFVEDPATIWQLVERYGSRPVDSTSADPAVYNAELVARLLKVEQARIAKIEGKLAADPDHLQSFNDDWSILVVSTSVRLDLQLLSLEPTLGTQWWRAAARSWKLVLLCDRRRAIEQELQMLETGVMPSLRHAMMQTTVTTINDAVEEQNAFATGLSAP
jgi:hypothetical protein